MKTLVLGASGATGKTAVQHLLDRHSTVRVLTRASSSIPEDWHSHPSVEIVYGNIAEYSVEDAVKLIDGCSAVICCLGHNITLKGLYGKPRKLVTGAVKTVCAAIEASAETPVRFVLMSTVAMDHPELPEPRSILFRFLLSLFMAVLPPHRDNVLAARYLIREVGTDSNNIQWTAVRPDTLVNEGQVSRYEAFETIQKDPPSSPPITSRTNTGHFMAALACENDLWETWRYKLPVLYNSNKD